MSDIDVLRARFVALGGTVRPGLPDDVIPTLEGLTEAARRLRVEAEKLARK